MEIIVHAVLSCNQQKRVESFNIPSIVENNEEEQDQLLKFVGIKVAFA